ncbi:DUF4102 domain-containing protein [Mariprofundus erugo]|uniref:tyrosine-type recombinase/integrase n=1 Tax=Mariprofundus erugo TaxID=2528639 RepID=UPI0010FE4EEB|nr:tyrosine-type recombinase/integrase [Mariprofundus erugo]TLS78301.1 DUF4102 domain-containing protein [Mariprofundus erugo]
MNLTDMQIKNAKVAEGKKQTKLYDGAGLYLLVRPSGRYWRYDFEILGKRRTYAIGKYPDIPLAGRIGKSGDYVKGARDHCMEIKALIAQGIDPILLRQEQKQRNLEEASRKEAEDSLVKNTFEVVAREWFALKQYEWVDKHASKQIGRLENYVFPYIGATPINVLTKPEVNQPIKNAVAQGVNDTARRLYFLVKNIFSFAMDHGYVDSVPLSSTLSSLVPSKPSTKMPAITEDTKIGELLRSVLDYNGSYVVRMALQIMPYLAVRPGEFRMAKWNEFDLDSGIWIIPAKHRKLKKAKKEDQDNVHIVPLSSQVVALLRQLYQFTGRGNHVFPSVRGDSRSISENTITQALGALGYKGEMVPHGFRAMFSTLMNEKGFNPDAIEKQLAHQCRDKVRDAYNRAGYMAERFDMMQVYAKHLDSLRDSS